MTDVKRAVIYTLMREWQSSEKSIESQTEFYETNKTLLKAEKQFVIDNESENLFCEMRYTCEDFGFMQGLKCAFALFKELQE